MTARRGRAAAIGSLAAAFLIAPAVPTVQAAAPAPTSAPAATAFRSRVFASGSRLTHATARGREAISKPDDITALGGHIFVGFQNGVGPQGEPSTTGNRRSTVVEFSLAGRAIAQWDVVGKCDGLTADPAIDRVIATVNEDAHSAIDLIDPAAGSRVAHYRFSRPLSSRGGTDAISVYYGMILISASAPGTTGAPAPRRAYPAVYRTILDSRTHVATVHPLFSDEATAVVVNTGGAARGHRIRLALTDPDSNEVVPAFAHRFAGDFMLTSQGDKEQIFVRHAGTRAQQLLVLHLSDAVDDTVWAASRTGVIYTTDNAADTVDEITGPFRRGEVLVADTPCDAVGAPATCPGPGFPANHLGRLNPLTGAITSIAVTGAPVAPQGMIFLP